MDSGEWVLAEAGGRLDAWLASLLAISRAEAQRRIGRGAVSVNGKAARKGQLVVAGDRVTMSKELGNEGAIANPGLPLCVVYEDEALVVVDKPAGQPSHPLRPGEDRTLANALVARFPEMAGVGHHPREPGLIHRLDNDTSGLLVAARDGDAFAALWQSLRAGRWDKRYRAVALGCPTPGIIAGRLAADRKHRARVCVLPRDKRSLWGEENVPRTRIVAVTPLEGGFSEVELAISCAQRHQIRAHLAHAGHPLVGDVLYGGPQVPGVMGHRLHAVSIRLPHPARAETLTVTSGTRIPAKTLGDSGEI